MTDSTDARAQGVYHFLDVGGTKYGECILVEFGALRILIDGSHVGDFKGQQGYDSIPDQLQQILGGRPPYDITLVVVTHGHADHVGCLPELFAHNIIKPKYALVTDAKLGFGRTVDDDTGPLDTVSPAARLAALLREEDASDLDDEDLQAFADAAVSVESRYTTFLKRMREKGVEVISYQGKPLPPALAQLLATTGLQLLGPSEKQLLLCAEQISTTNKEAEDAADAIVGVGDVQLLDLYRSIVRAEADAVRNPRGNGMNCQSITFAFGPPSARVLLAGDMQFAEPGVKGADEEVAALRERVIAAGPYKLFKTTHHSSHNGQDADFLDSIGNPELIVHSGGLHDTSHPWPAVLTMLKRRRGMRFVRTDHNGLISAKPHLPAAEALEISRGRTNDFTPNTSHDELPAEPLPVQGTVVRSAPSGTGLQIVIVNLPNQPVDLTVAGVDIRVRSVDAVEAPAAPSGSGNDNGRRIISSRPVTPPVLPALDVSRSFDGLLFVTDSGKLRSNVGNAAADSVLDAIQKAGGVVQSAIGDRMLDSTRQALKENTALKGVVLLGGYDVVPSVRTDVLDAELRGLLGSRRIEADHDQFYVWSDKLYGDRDGDSVAELPVSRVPDAGDSTLFHAAIGAKPFTAEERFGVRNVVRQFADTAWSSSLGTSRLKVCAPFAAGDVRSPEVDSACHYFMLHGRATDGTRFEGEDVFGGYPLAFTVDKVPARFSGTVFNGCCWGALIVNGLAKDWDGVRPPASRVPGQSIALSYLKAGAVAYIGCTGSHYSGPDTDPDVNYAAHLHRAFWDALSQPGWTPAAALHRAKQDYLRWILEQGSRLDPLDTARRLKNFTQFTCLGLGW